MTNDWRPMSEHVFPWSHRCVLVMAFGKDDDPANSDGLEILRCRVAEHGAMFQVNGGMLSIHEEGWIPFAWRLDDCPARDDAKWPPLWSDYLTDPDNLDHMAR